MSTTPVVAAAPKLSFLQKLGQDFTKIFKQVVIGAQVAEPIVDTLMPGWAGLYNTTVQLAVNVEATATAAGAQNGTGAQKLASVTSALQPLATAYLTSIGVSSPTTAQIQAYINSVVAGLNAFEALENPVAAPVPAVATAA